MPQREPAAIQAPFAFRGDFEGLAIAMLRQLRGRLSQIEFSRRLGYRSNIAYLWESGRHWPTAATALRAADQMGIDVQAATARFCGLPARWFAQEGAPTRAGIARMLDAMRGETPVVEVAARVGRSRFAVSRWLKGRAEPRLPDFLRMIEALSQRAVAFVAEVGSAQPQAKALSGLGVRPEVMAVLLALQTQAYAALDRHRDEWVARRIGIAEPRVRTCLEWLAQNGLIALSENRWTVQLPSSIDAPAGASHALDEWCQQMGRAALKRQPAGEHTYAVLAVSERDYARMVEMHRAHLRELRAIAAASSPAQRVIVTNAQLFALDERD